MHSELQLADYLERFEPADVDRIRAALDWATELHEGSYRASGEPTVTHPVRVAAIVASMGLDADSVVASLLHQALEDTRATKAVVEQRFGERVAALVDEMSRMASLKAKNKTLKAAETIRKMLFSMTRDLRVIIIKLADKLDNMRTIKWLPEEDRRRIAAECVDVFAPLAGRLGISWMKDELEDLALKEINREAFDQIKLLVSAKKAEREAFLEKARTEIESAANAEGITVEVHARAKHFYSIYQKMRKRAKSSDELFDLSGIRVLCESESECYAALGVVHGLWKPLEGRFKDYIAMPKNNGYRSLHTTVMAWDGTLLEIQIRTYDMHSVAEFGVASHWLYKKGTSNEVVDQSSLAIVNKLKDWNAVLESGAEFLEDIKREILKDSIIVFTPKGDAIELPAGSTPLDFAYAIHSDVGNRCLAAKAGGAIVPLDSELRNTQVVDIITSANARPNINWLNIVRTSKARSKIRAWLVAEGTVLAIDKNVVARKRDDKDARHDDKARGLAPDRRVELEVRHGEAKHTEPKKPEASELAAAPMDYRPYTPGEATDSTKAGVNVSGAGSLMVRFAACCKPAVGDRIVGYVSRGRGIIVHRASCKNLANIAEFTERRVDVSWETAPGLTRRYHVVGRRVLDLFSEIENAVRKHGGRLVEGRLEDGQDTLAGNFTMAYPSAEDARTAERNLRHVPSILKIKRID
ncbi:MAG: bifunctional (p)ppGpp synthetase/guanosine-3',5'-bis(diphosphate) 3'-pyrophosphohydrolase [Spirochaetales bacterium]|nr:bifunctional (p)ppGpp synthetase/guanosine-3',5'-bis(diphosphate) 3'-pyrophosphohydrolase [Spirochaetales bacterium]